MAQRESTFINMVGCLLVVTLVSGGILGFVHSKTEGAIEAARTMEQNVAIAKVLPEFTELGKPLRLLPAEGSDSIEIFSAYKEGKMVGMAIKTYSEKGFSGNITMMAGLDTLGNLTGYEILQHKETPGLGSKMGTWFRNPDKPNQNVIGKNFETTRFSVKKDGGDIDAITASTITSRAFLDALKRAYSGYQQYRPENRVSKEQLIP